MGMWFMRGAVAPVMMGVALTALLSGCATPVGSEEEVRLRRGEHAVAPTTSVEQADARLADVKERRSVVEAQFAVSERVCYTRFFVNHCLDQAKEIRRGALVDLRAVEIEASHYKRAESVERRDKALAEDNRKAEEELAARMAKPEAEAKPAPPAATPKKPAAQTLAQRQAQHDAKVRQQQAVEAAGASKRTAREAAYVKRQEDAAKRQQKVVEKQAEKQQKADQREAAKAASAASAASAAQNNQN